MGKINKLLLNYSLSALKVLGFTGYCVYVFRSLGHIPGILKKRDLRPVDQAMGKSPVLCHMYGKAFRVDTAFADSRIKDGTFTFGLIRELYIRNCYLRGAQLDQCLPTCKVAVDIGANRGVFSTLLSQFAQKVISVEVLPEFADVIRRNMEINHYAGNHIENSFMGAGGNYESRSKGTITMEELFAKYDVSKVDIMKMDIEGSEFALFQHPDWLAKVGALCMEVHPAYGRVEDILNTLKQQGFTVECANSMFHPVADPQEAEFIWALRRA